MTTSFIGRLQPDIQLVRREVIQTLNLDVSFAQLFGGATRLRNIYLSSSSADTVTISQGRVTWMGGNASKITTLNIAGGLVEWTGSSASEVIFNFDNNYDLSHGSVNMNIIFDADVRDATIEIDLFTTTGAMLSATWPVVSKDTVAHVFDLTFPTSQTVEDIKFKNICRRAVTIDNMALSWTGDADLKRIEIPQRKP